MKTHIEFQSKDYDALAIWPMTAPLLDTRPAHLRGPEVGLHLHAYKAGRKVVHGTFDYIVVDGKRYDSGQSRVGA